MEFPNKQKLQRQGVESTTPESFHEVESNEDIESELFHAAAKGDVDMIQYLIENGTDIHTKNRNGEIVLVLGAKNGDERLV